MSQQSNPATLREALSELRCVADNLYMNLKAAAQFNPEGFNTPALEQVFQRFKTAAAKSVEIETALAASGTEAAPSEPFGYAYRYPDGIRFNTGGIEINAAKPTEAIPLYTHPAQAAASPEGEWREATCFAIAALEPERLKSTEYKTGFIDAKNFALELVQHQSAAPSGGAAREPISDLVNEIQRLAAKWDHDQRDSEHSYGEKVHAEWCRKCALQEALAQESKTGAVTDARSQGEVGLGHGGAPPDGAGSSPAASIPESGETGAAPFRNRRKQNIPYRCGHDDCPCTGGRLHVSNRAPDQKLAGETGAVTETK